jgi:hypothetical protein
MIHAHQRPILSNVFDPYAQFTEAAEKEWHAFREERTAGVEEVSQLRQRVAEEEARKRIEREKEKEIEAETADVDKEMVTDQPETKTAPAEEIKPADEEKPTAEAEMEVDDVAPPAQEENKEERKDEPIGDDDDAVEY